MSKLTSNKRDGSHRNDQIFNYRKVVNSRMAATEPVAVAGPSTKTIEKSNVAPKITAYASDATKENKTVRPKSNLTTRSAPQLSGLHKKDLNPKNVTEKKIVATMPAAVAGPSRETSNKHYISKIPARTFVTAKRNTDGQNCVATSKCDSIKPSEPHKEQNLNQIKITENRKAASGLAIEQNTFNNESMPGVITPPSGYEARYNSLFHKYVILTSEYRDLKEKYEEMSNNYAKAQQMIFIKTAETEKLFNAFEDLKVKLILQSLNKV